MRKVVLPNYETKKGSAFTYEEEKKLINHHLHELRYTFITRAKECGVHGEVVMLWDGHEEDKTIHSSRIDRGYTDFSDEFLLKEANKVDYLQWDFGEVKA